MFNLFFRSKPQPDIKRKCPPEHIKYRLKLDDERLFLEFESETEVSALGESLDGYEYQLNGRIYTDVASYAADELEKLSDKVSVNKDSYGYKVLHTYTQVPTFDSGDREWDSAIHEFLMFDGRDINLVKCRRGFKIASITIYGKLISATENSRTWLERLGFPADDVTFTDMP